MATKKNLAPLGVKREGYDMSRSVNKVIIVGALGRDPEVRTFQNGGKVCNLSVATSETWKDKQSGERKERTEWHSVAVMNEPAVKFAEQYLRKGAKVYIEGQLQTRKWQDQSGADRYSTEVVLRPFNGELIALDSQGNSGEREPRQERQEQGNPPASRDLNDDIPFAAEWRA